ncbi:hypothetical protein [Pseudonocardia kunmingensis]|uniref:Uncharacterized protein n=1 Tax=Pseudonocardia kunmingensis TaxID=630975 RepID=A0A543D0G0_9PSEU|nr:hypothetical protein [Pseudonocardia kunmingensis]TQM02839.1 hypothetical protein FB558_7482 [Pseudonocardia kunmingensis]
MTAFYLFGAALTAVLYPVLLAKRYRGRRRWIVVGVVLGLVAALVWPVTLWVAVALWLTGFTRPSTGVRRRRRVVFPLAACGSLATFVIIGLIVGPAPASPAGTPAAVADVIATTTPAVPTTTAAPTTAPPPPSTAPAVTTTTRPPVATTTTPPPQPKPKPQPEPNPEPRHDPAPDADRDDSGTKPRTGNSGHPCGPGERDGDGDGYCGEG